MLVGGRVKEKLWKNNIFVDLLNEWASFRDVLMALHQTL
jgi:hypothetical protein